MEARAMPHKQRSKKTALQEYYETPEDVKCELINGEIVMMAEPSDEHQRAALALTLDIGSYLRGKACVLRYEESVELNAEDVFVPDIVVVCDRSKFRPHGIVGAPDLVIEIASPSTASYDAVTKFNKYRDAGVREYWIVHTEVKYISQHVLSEGAYTTHNYRVPDKIKVHVLDDCIIDLSDVFPELMSTAADQTDSQSEL